MKKLVLLALAAVSAVMLVVPALASAGEWEMDPAGWAFNITSVGNTVLKTNNNETVTCTSSTGSGAYNAGSKTTGTIQLLFHGCKESIFGTSCSSEGQASGTIATTAGLTFTNVYLKPVKTTPGVTIRGIGAEEHFATFTCAGGSVKIKVTGTILGDSENGCNSAAEEQKIVFESIEHGVQRYTRVTEDVTNPIEDLTADVTIFGATNLRTASQDGTGILKSKIAGEKATITCV
jgi:hypothetical protein